jgi:hypothetical protein
MADQRTDLVADAGTSRGILVWLKRDLPPLTIFEGPDKNQESSISCCDS